MSFSRVIPIAIPTANSNGKLSIIAVPDSIKNAAIQLLLPQPTGSIQYPIPFNNAAIGITDTGNIKDFPKR